MGHGGSRRGVQVFRLHTLLDHYFLRVIESDISYRLPTGAWSRTVSRVRVDSGLSVAALLFERPSRQLHFVRQFRFPTYDFERAERAEKGWLVELVAGRAKTNEDPDVAIVREIREEVDLDVRALKRIGRFYLSPGASSEELILYFAEVGPPAEGQKGLSAAGDMDEEYIERVSMTVDDFLQKVEEQTIADAKTICAAEWLRRNRSSLLAPKS